MKIIEMIKVIILLCKVLCMLTGMLSNLALQISGKDISKEVYSYIEALSLKNELAQAAEGNRASK